MTLATPVRIGWRLRPDTPEISLNRHAATSSPLPVRWPLLALMGTASNARCSRRQTPDALSLGAVAAASSPVTRGPKGAYSALSCGPAAGASLVDPRRQSGRVSNGGRCISMPVCPQGKARLRKWKAAILSVQLRPLHHSLMVARSAGVAALTTLGDRAGLRRENRLMRLRRRWQKQPADAKMWAC